MFGITWPLRNVALVYWLRGSAAYHEQGVRIASGKPTRFSTGERVPDLPDIVTGAAAFFIAMFLALALVIVARRLIRNATNA